MSVTVADCLKLPALREARAVAGERGLDRIVTAVSVLEYVDFTVLAHDFFIGNELIITAFTSIMHDTEAQCRTIQRLKEAGEVGIIIYYVGIFVPRLDERLLKLADELDFPIIRMPLDRLDFRYSDVISEVLEAIFKDRQKETHFVNGMLERISQLNNQQQTISTVLRMLSDQLRCTLLLCDSSFKRLGYATWPMSSSLSYETVLKQFESTPQLAGDKILVASIPGKQMKIYHMALDEEQYTGIRLMAADVQGSLDKDQLKQAAELILLFSNIWNYNFDGEMADSLIPAILNDDPEKMRRIASALNIDVTSINTMWIIRAEKPWLSSAERHIFNERIIVKAKFFLRDHDKALLVDTYENNVVLLLGSPKHADLDAGILESFQDILASMDFPHSITVCTNLADTTDARAAYILFSDCIDSARRIYPARSLFTIFELQFAQECAQLVRQGGEELERYQYPIRHLRTQDDGQDLIDTLAVYLLDTESNMQETGNLLYLHKNTVKYRLNKIKQRLDYDISKMPEAMGLYRAVALDRFTRTKA